RALRPGARARDGYARSSSGTCLLPRLTHGHEVDPVRAGRRDQREVARREHRVQLPRLHRDDELRLSGDALARDLVATRQRIRTVLDPDLPVGLVAAIREVMTH